MCEQNSIWQRENINKIKIRSINQLKFQIWKHIQSTSLIPDHEIVSLLDKKLTRWSSASYDSKKKEKIKKGVAFVMGRVSMDVGVELVKRV